VNTPGGKEEGGQSLFGKEEDLARKFRRLRLRREEEKGGRILPVLEERKEMIVLSG